MAPHCSVAMQEAFQGSSWWVARSPEGRCGEEKRRFGQNVEDWMRFPVVERSLNIR